jgi:dihydroxy-acid dehydratase
VAGPSMGAVLEAAVVADDDVVRPIERAYSTRPSILLVRGSLAPDGAFVKRPVDDPAHGQVFRGPAVVFSSRDEALEGLRDGGVRPGHVAVLAGLGPRGGPGMALASAFVFALDGAGLGESVAVVTDGQLSGLVNTGTVVGEVSPEAALGGPLALVEDGDQITIDLSARTVDLDVPEQVLAVRRTAFQDRAADTPDYGWLSVYRRLVTDVASGAVISE